MEGMMKWKNGKLANLHFRHLLRQIHLIDLLLGFDATIFYPSAMWDEKAIETGYAFKREMNNELVNKIKNRTFTKMSALLKKSVSSQKQ